MNLRGMKKATCFIIFGFLFFLLWNQSSPMVKAATPVLKNTEVKIEGVGEVYQLEILHRVAKSKYQWSSSNQSVVTVNEKGLLTSIKKGTATIRCKITYPSQKTKNLYCNVKVTIPATDIKINNANISNGAHVMVVGSSYNFNRTLTPAKSSDETYWYLDTTDMDANPDAIRIDNPYNGTITALRTGKIVLVAAAVGEATLEAAQESEIKDAVIIEVVGSSAEVISAEMPSSKTIKVVFGKAIKESTVVNTNGTLTNNIQISRLNDTKGETAKDPGILTAFLSASGKTLTITASDYFQGDYGVTFYNSIRTTDGEALYQEYFKLSYTTTVAYDDNANTDTDTETEDSTDTNGQVVDTTLPKIESVELSDNGMLNSINFTEAMDFSDFTVSDAKTSANSVMARTGTIDFMNNKTNYTFSADRKSILINLASIDQDDYDKAFTILISGVTDTAGNYLANNSVTVSLRTETSPKAQARPILIVRSSYDTVTATFDRSIKKPGYGYINDSLCSCVVNSDNPKQVIYTIPYSALDLSGNQKVSIGLWDSYNVITSDTYANSLHNFQVDFTTEKIRPILISYSFDAELDILKLIFSENVRLLVKQGFLTSKIDSYQNNNMSALVYYTEASTVNNVIEIMLSNMTLYGDYTFTLPEGSVVDNYQNKSFSNPITISKGSGGGAVNQLAEPYSIRQADANHSLVYVYFADKLDEATALNQGYYSIGGAVIKEVNLISNTADGAIVRLTLEKGSITTSGARTMTINGIKGYNGSATQMADYSTKVTLLENVDPQLLSVKYNATTKNTVELTFTEAIKGNMAVTIKERSTGALVGNTVAVSGTKVILTLTNVPTDGTYLRILVENNSITDLSGNESTIDPELNAFVNY